MTESMWWRSFIKFPQFVIKHGYHGQFLFLIGRYKKSPPLKQLGQMEPYLTGSICDRLWGGLYSFLISSSSDNKYCHHVRFLFIFGGYFRFCFPLERFGQKGTKLDRKHLWEAIYSFLFCPDQTINIAVISNSFFLNS